jgi:hypothetical protein
MEGMRKTHNQPCIFFLNKHTVLSLILCFFALTSKNAHKRINLPHLFLDKKNTVDNYFSGNGAIFSVRLPFYPGKWYTIFHEVQKQTMPEQSWRHAPLPHQGGYKRQGDQMAADWLAVLSGMQTDATGLMVVGGSVALSGLEKKDFS